MIQMTERDLLVVHAVLMCVPCLSSRSLTALWPDTPSGRENRDRRLFQLGAEGLLVGHTSFAQEADGVDLFYHWAPGQPEPDFGSLAWALAKRWERVAHDKVAFFTAGEKAARHYGRTVTNPLKSVSALSHNLGLGAVYVRYTTLHPELARAWVSEEVLAAARGYGEKVVDAAIVDSTGTPALAVEFAGASYAASNGERLREIHADCAVRRLPYELWTVAEGTR